MRSIIRAIAAMLRAMPKFVMEKVWDGARWIQRLIAVPQPFELQTPEVDNGVDADAAHVAALRKAAAHLASGSVPPDGVMDALREHDIAWLAALTRPMLCRVAVATDEALMAHIRRQRPIKRLLACDANAIADFRNAARIERMRAIEAKELALTLA